MLYPLVDFVENYGGGDNLGGFILVNDPVIELSLGSVGKPLYPAVGVNGRPDSASCPS